MVTHAQLMEVGLTGQRGISAVSHAAMEPNSAVALAPILLRLMVERNAVGTRPRLESAITALAHVSNRKKHSIFLQSIGQVVDYLPKRLIK